MTNDIPDDEVLKDAISGDQEAFSILYNRYVEKIYNYIYYRTGSTLDAEDLTAKVFFRALGHIQNYKYRGVPFSAWLYRIAHNLVANWHRDNSRRKEVSIEDHLNYQEGSEHPESLLVISQENEWIMKAIKQLPPERQQLVILKFVERMSNAEIAMILGRSEGAIKSLYHRTLISLRKKTEKINKT